MVSSSPAGTTFTLVLPGLRQGAEPVPVDAASLPGPDELAPT
jgi:hypothetical protein